MVRKRAGSFSGYHLCNSECCAIWFGECRQWEGGKGFLSLLPREQTHFPSIGTAAELLSLNKKGVDFNPVPLIYYLVEYFSLQDSGSVGTEF